MTRYSTNKIKQSHVVDIFIWTKFSQNSLISENDLIQFIGVILLRLTSFTTKWSQDKTILQVVRVSLTLECKVNSILSPKGESNCLVILGFKEHDIYNSEKYVFHIFWVWVYKMGSRKKCYK